jgi:nucleoid-associated protein YgaU
MSIFDSIKNAFGGKAESEADATQSPSQLLNDAGIDPSGLDFGFGTNSITVSGEIGDEADRQKILDILASAPGIETVEDNMTVSTPAPVEPPADAEDAEPEAGGSETSAPAESDSGAQTYTVQSGDTLWRISEQVYGNGSKYMKIFEANTGILEHPDQIFPGQVLVIPEAGDK